MSRCRIPAERLVRDPYFDTGYVALYTEGDAEPFYFRYEEGSHFFQAAALKRPIRQVAGKPVPEGLYDLESAYGYGGYILQSDDPAFLETALERYVRHCRESGIVAEFVRFHPFNPSIAAFEPFFDFFAEDRPTVCVDATLDKEARWSNYSPKVRRKLRKCERELLFRPTDDLDAFYRLYTQTMTRNRAESFYFFDYPFFQRLLALPYARLYEVRDEEEPVSMGFALLGPDIAHIHLSGNLATKMRRNGNYLLFDGIFQEAHEAGCRYAFVGGGRTNDPRDTLLRFKRQFATGELPFFIAGKIFLPETYDMLVEKWRQAYPHMAAFPYFLKYRLKGERS